MTTRCASSSLLLVGLPTVLRGKSAQRMSPYASSRYGSIPTLRLTADTAAQPLGRDRLLLPHQAELQAVFGRHDLGDGETEWHRLEGDWSQRSSQQCLGSEIRQVHSGDGNLRIAQRHGLILGVEPRQAADHGLDLSADDSGIDRDLHPPITAIGKWRASER